jgi:putative Holliday junction resolvase
MPKKGRGPYTSPIFRLQPLFVRMVVSHIRRAVRLVLAASPMNRPISVEDLASRLPAKARLLGLDLGTKTIGLAISDVERRLASPLKTLARGPFRRDATALVTIFSEFEIAGVILGLPLDLDGRSGPRAQSTRAFAHNLSACTEVPIAYWDERFSTAAVNRALIANDVSRGRRARVVDKMAAAYILQGALDRMSGLARAKPDF